MINLLIIDDEPLVQAGLRSMLDWKSMGINIIGTSMNGAAALEIIRSHKTDICITDIKMPVMDGLTLLQKCREEMEEPPLFIMLTSYEEFRLVQESIKLQAFDYLIKLDLTPPKLREAVERAVTHIEKNRRTTDSPVSELNSYRERFYLCLINNIFGSEQNFRTQCEVLGLNFDSPAYCACHMNIESDNTAGMEQGQRMSLYGSTVQMVQEIISKYIPCQVISLDVSHCAVVLFLSQEVADNSKMFISDALEHCSNMLHNYYGVFLTTGVGAAVSSPMEIASSYAEAKYAALIAPERRSVVFAGDSPDEGNKPFNMALYRQNIQKAYYEYDANAMRDIFDSIIEKLEQPPAMRTLAMDAASNILYLSITLLANGEETVSEIFSGEPNGYRSLYGLSTVSQITEWMRTLCSGLCACFESHRRSYKCQIVEEVRQYIRAHIEEKLTLNSVSGVFNISPNYLSHLFSKYSDTGFVEYVNAVKIDAAKRMLDEGSLRIYEIANNLGFENAFYFSRVFKKTTGLSPSEYMSRNG